MAVLELIVVLEQRFGITVEDEHVTAEAFETLASLTEFVDPAGPMRLGPHIRTLARLWPWVAGGAGLALLMAIWSVAQIGVIPPRLEPRALEMASATTHVIVDTPRSSILDLRQDTYSLEAFRQRAIVLGNVMAEGQVRQAIEDRSRVSRRRLQVTPPLTPEQPRAVEGSENQKHTTDILKSTDQYRLSIQTNPTVPIMDIYSQAPSAESAEAWPTGRWSSCAVTLPISRSPSARRRRTRFASSNSVRLAAR